jgi:hypothetical protein
MTVADVQLTPPPPSHPVYPPHLKRWEQRLLHKYVVASTPSENSLHFKVKIVTTDTLQLISFMALLDCRAISLFVDQGFVDRNRITTRTLSCPIPVYNIDRTMNEAGSIHEVVDVVLHYKDHSERVQFAVTGLGEQDAILGYTWLKEHNLEVNWITKEVKMSRCPGCCSTCRKEIKQEHHQHQIKARHLHACRASLMYTVEDVSEDIPELYPDTEDDSGDEEDETDNTEALDEIEEGDRIFMTTVYDQAKFVRASATTSQHLSEAFAKNSAPPKSFWESVHKAFHDFEDVFSKESFNELPERKPWDHAIELELGAKASFTKIYPLMSLHTLCPRSHEFSWYFCDCIQFATQCRSSRLKPLLASTAPPHCLVSTSCLPRTASHQVKICTASDHQNGHSMEHTRSCNVSALLPRFVWHRLLTVSSSASHMSI